MELRKRIDPTDIDGFYFPCRIYDKEGNGYITTDVLKEILHEIDPELTNDDLEGIVEEVDEDGSGTLDFDGKQPYYKAN